MTKSGTGRRSRRLWISVGAALAAACLLVLLLSHDGAMSAVQAAYARITSVVLNLLGHSTRVEGSTVSSAQFGISVVAACTGLFVTALFVLAVLVFPAGWVAKLCGVALGVGGIFLINLIRLVSLYYVGLHWPRVLESVHLLVWQSLLIVLAVALWLLWAARIAGRREEAAS